MDYAMRAASGAVSGSAMVFARKRCTRFRSAVIRFSDSARLLVCPRYWRRMHISMKRVRAASAQKGSEDPTSEGIDRKSVVKGKRVSERGDLVGGRFFKKKKRKQL